MDVSFPYLSTAHYLNLPNSLYVQGNINKRSGYSYWSQFNPQSSIYISGDQTAEHGFGAPEIYFGAILGAPKVHCVIILDSLARPDIRYIAFYYCLQRFDFCRRYALCNCQRFMLIFDTPLY